ncbi:MAG: hypothetical protein AYL29_011220 [Candidatus Bathyarchaeota archaeon B24]|nr:MAG: hypothetical protein AYL29_011220 [Candidatus Bathyarchaeota archaeon B24]
MNDELKAIDPKTVKVLKAGLDTVDISVNGKLYSNVIPRKPFPLSHPEVVLLCTEDGREIGVIEDCRKLDAKSRGELEKVLDVIYYIPRIKRINKIDHKEQKYVWKVEIEEGKDIEIVTWSRCVRIMPDGRIFIKDVNGHYYEVRSLSSLDLKSKILLGTMI